MEEKGIHDGHRKRVRESFLKRDIESMPDHEILELLLFYAYSRRDTNEIAHRLINHFGSLELVLNAPFDELKSVKDVGENAATLIVLFSRFAKLYQKKINQIKGKVSSESAKEYLKSAFQGKRNEYIIAIFCDGRDNYINLKEFDNGSSSKVDFKPRELVEAAVRCNASKVVIAHNHPRGYAVPSDSDIQSTVRIKDLLYDLDIELTDHIIVASNDCFSMRESKKYSVIFE